MTPHYPLNGIDLDFSRYEHRPLSGRDVMINRMMEDYMFPRRVKPRVYLNVTEGNSLFGPFKAQNRELGLDIQVMSKLLKTGSTVTQQKALQLLHSGKTQQKTLLFLCSGITSSQYMAWKTMNLYSSDERINQWPVLETMILGLIQRYFLEVNPHMRIWLKDFRRRSLRPKPKSASEWKRDMKEHLKVLQPPAATHYHNFLFSGGHWLPLDRPSSMQFSIDPCFIASYQLWIHLPKAVHKCKSQGKEPTAQIPFSNIQGLHRGRPRRSLSTPPPGTWSTTIMQSGVYPEYEEQYYVLFFPRRPLSELDKMSRRRSLSRTHIRAMFTDKPKWIFEGPGIDKPSAQFKHPCANCAQYSHHTRKCPETCGYCSSPFHKASSCTVKAANRCKCRPFPQHHTASECFVHCSRKCGAPHPPGNFRHKNAMMCSHRCCMCGIKGHSGRKCALKKCPCGQQHLGQDCRWKVECSVKQCDRYNCHVHCRECGKKKDKGAKEHFVGNTCQDCLKNGQPASPQAV
ncbi:hypothetical protein F5B20DRAFT_413293 [Whalleya microplaca]|nr:hypothetical protein F5B20DRAFT_413293 [Whalleya microplaca]